MAKVKPTLNQADLNLLEKKFVTKDDLKAMEDRQDNNYAAKDDLKQFATKDELKKIIGDEFHNQFSEHFANMIKPEFEKIDKRFETLEKKFETTEKHLTNQFDGLKSEFSLQVSKKEFNKLKVRVDKHFPAN